MIKEFDGFERYQIGDEIHLNIEVIVTVKTREIIINKEILKGHLKRYIKFILSEDKYKGPCVI